MAMADVATTRVPVVVEMEGAVAVVVTAEVVPVVAAEAAPTVATHTAIARDTRYQQTKSLAR